MKKEDYDKDFIDLSYKKIMIPILISVYNRKKHFLECIEYLKKNKIAEKSCLYIVSDAAYREEDKEIIKEIREEIGKITGFKKVIKIFRAKNMGSHASITGAILNVFEEYESLIFLEDDILVSSNFLSYMNEALNFYKDYENIFSVSGYLMPNLRIRGMIKEDVFLLKRYSAWGVGIWKEKYLKVEGSLIRYKELETDKKLIKKYCETDPSLFNNLEADRKGKVLAADSRTQFHIFINNLYSVFPKNTLTVNRGHDGSGEHCKKPIFRNKYLAQEFNPLFNPKCVETIKEYKNVNRQLYKSNRSIRTQVIKPILKSVGLFEFGKSLAKKLDI